MTAAALIRLFRSRLVAAVLLSPGLLFSCQRAEVVPVKVSPLVGTYTLRENVFNDPQAPRTIAVARVKDNRYAVGFGTTRYDANWNEQWQRLEIQVPQCTAEGYSTITFLFRPVAGYVYLADGCQDNAQFEGHYLRVEPE